MMDSASTDPELRQWLCWAPEEGNAPAFVNNVADAGCLACRPHFEMLRPLLVELKPQRPEPQPGPAVEDDTELFGWLCWAPTGGEVRSFVRALVEAAFRACAADYALLRAVESLF